MGKDKDDYMECLDIKVLEQTENGYVLLYALNILPGFGNVIRDKSIKR